MSEVDIETESEKIQYEVSLTGVTLDEGWRFLKYGEPLQEGDGVLHPDFSGSWIDFVCRPDMFRGNKLFNTPVRDYAHTWPWRRRIPKAGVREVQNTKRKISLKSLQQERDFLKTEISKIEKLLADLRQEYRCINNLLKDRGSATRNQEYS